MNKILQTEITKLEKIELKTIKYNLLIVLEKIEKNEFIETDKYGK